MEEKIKKDNELLEEYNAQVVADDKHEYSVYAVDHSDYSDSCC